MTVIKQVRQLGLPFATADRSAGKPVRPVAEAEADRTDSATSAEPKAKDKEQGAAPATMEHVVERMEEAFRKVASNRGAPGPDRQTIEAVRKHLPELMPKLSRALLEGTYRPGDIRRVWIPKAGGGERGLGIPNVVDRVVQEAVRQVLEPLYEPTFQESSHGFRPGRSCHTAISQAYKYVDEGYEFVVDLDLEKFFDRVNHQRLMSRLAKRIKNKPLLELIGRMLKAKVVMPDGVKVSTEEGVPQGGPLSPLLSNIVLDELDQELVRRGHCFVRYADDCNIYVRSERAGQRVKASITKFIKGRLRLQVNEGKSAVSRPEERHFLGFRLRREPKDGSVEILLSKRSEERIKSRIVELTPRNWGGSMRSCIKGVNRYISGWLGFFWICTEATERTLHNLDAHIRRRLRALQMKHWRRKRTIAKRLSRLGMKATTAWRSVYDGQKNIWALSLYPGNTGLRNAYFAELGLKSLVEQWKSRTQAAMAAPEEMRPAYLLG